LLDARRNNFYYTYCDTNGNPIIDTTFDSFENIEKIAERLENSILVKNTDFLESPILDARNMCNEAYQKFMAKKFEDIRLFEPNYIINNYVKS
jgi:tRNA A37 threonylcarbamoyladenosine modification protein TsaB